MSDARASVRLSASVIRKSWGPGRRSRTVWCRRNGSTNEGPGWTESSPYGYSVWSLSELIKLDQTGGQVRVSKRYGQGRRPRFSSVRRLLSRSLTILPKRRQGYRHVDQRPLPTLPAAFDRVVVAEFPCSVSSFSSSSAASSTRSASCWRQACPGLGCSTVTFDVRFPIRLGQVHRARCFFFDHDSSSSSPTSPRRWAHAVPADVQPRTKSNTSCCGESGGPHRRTTPAIAAHPRTAGLVHRPHRFRHLAQLERRTRHDCSNGQHDE